MVLYCPSLVQFTACWFTTCWVTYMYLGYCARIIMDTNKPGIVCMHKKSKTKEHTTIFDCTKTNRTHTKQDGCVPCANYNQSGSDDYSHNVFKFDERIILEQQWMICSYYSLSHKHLASQIKGYHSGKKGLLMVTWYSL